MFKLTVRMLGERENAADATQEILPKVVTHFSCFRADAVFTTGAYQVARKHPLTEATRSKESPEVSLEGIAVRLQQGADFAAPLGGSRRHRPFADAARQSRSRNSVTREQSAGADGFLAGSVRTWRRPGR